MKQIKIVIASLLVGTAVPLLAEDPAGGMSPRRQEKLTLPDALQSELDWPNEAAPGAEIQVEEPRASMKTPLLEPSPGTSDRIRLSIQTILSWAIQGATAEVIDNFAEPDRSRIEDAGDIAAVEGVKQSFRRRWRLNYASSLSSSLRNVTLPLTFVQEDRDTVRTILRSETGELVLRFKRERGFLGTWWLLDVPNSVSSGVQVEARLDRTADDLREHTFNWALSEEEAGILVAEKLLEPFASERHRRR